MVFTQAHMFMDTLLLDILQTLAHKDILACMYTHLYT